VEFRYEGQAWRCGRFDALTAEFEVKAEELAEFVQAAHVNERGWLVTRRLFGIQPLVPPPTTSLDDLRPWTRPELQEALGLTRKQLGDELNAVRGAWQALRPKEAPGFALKFGSSAEKAWFCQRVQDYSKTLNEKFAAVLARDTLITELRIYQLDALMNDPDKCKPGDSQWHTNLKVRQALSERYQKLLAQIKELCPWAGAIAGKYNFGGSLGDVTKAIQEYKARGGTELIDGIFTLTEVLIDCRTSVQNPVPHYSAGFVLFATEAKAHLWDFRWAPELHHAGLRHVREAWTQAYQASWEADGAKKLPDLNADGPEGEYEELPDLTKPAGPEQSKENHVQQETK